jgi:hypothetical protein
MGALRKERAGSMDFDASVLKVTRKLTKLQEEDELIKKVRTKDQ